MLARAQSARASLLHFSIHNYFDLLLSHLAFHTGRCVAKMLSQLCVSIKLDFFINRKVSIPTHTIFQLTKSALSA
jgi:hypothetical protein